MGGSESDVALIGIDCAVDARNVGIAYAMHDARRLRLIDVKHGETRLAVADHVAAWLAMHARAVIALDAPLGWPARLGAVLADHAAGQAIGADAHTLFRRTTDDIVYERLGKRPLDVGADRIARTAHAALSLLDQLRTRTGREIRLAWEPGALCGTGAIEVYPAGTLASRGWPCGGYKGQAQDAVATRAELVCRLEPELELDSTANAAMIASDHLLDAVLCTIAAGDFVRGTVIRPESQTTAIREGWIWVRPPSPSPCENER